MAPEIDYQAVFEASPSGTVVLTRGFVIVAVNRAFLKVSGRDLTDLVGRNILDAFPENPDDAGSDGPQKLLASLNRVVATRRRDMLPIQRYDVEVADRPDEFEERYWSVINVPVCGRDGEVDLIIHRVEEVTSFVQQLRLARGPEGARLSAETAAMQTELYARTRELQDLNERLRRAHAREREVALALQRSMLPQILPSQRSYAAVRYLPAAGLVNVCGDWYDLVDLPGDRVAAAVGDVVGHGLAAAGVMGQLRSALSAAIRAVGEPALALEILSLYARSVDGALGTTAAQLIIDRPAGTITHSRAGHLPPLLLRAGGDCTAELLDHTVDPPLGVLPEHTPHLQSATAFTPGDTLVLYTDGLVERRGEDIDVGIDRLAASLARHGADSPDNLADKLLADLGAVGAADDSAVLVLRL